MNTWIPLLVRQEDYVELAQTVAEREVGRSDKSKPIQEEAALHVGSLEGGSGADGLAGSQLWPIETLAKFADSAKLYLTVERWCVALDVMCNHVGENVSSERLAAEAGMPITQWRDAPRKLTGHLAKHYDAGLGFPLIGRSGRDLKMDDQVYWSIAPEQARRWMQVRARSESADPVAKTPGGN